MPTIDRGRGRTSRPHRADARKSFYKKQRWVKFRRWYMSRNPFCEVSGKVGEVQPMEVLDHIIPMEAGGSPWDERNLMGMTSYWHNKKRQKESIKRIWVDTINTETGLIPARRGDIIRVLYGEVES